MSWFLLVLEAFEELLAATVNADAPGLERTCDVLVLRLYRDAGTNRGAVNPKEFESCMLASARAMLPESWGAQQEGAWVACWECIATELEATQKLPAKYDNVVTRFVEQLSSTQKTDVGTKAFKRLFEETPKAESYFKQSNSKLAFIVSKNLDSAAKLFKDPATQVVELQQLGLKHIMFQASTRFFQPFVSAIMKEVQLITKDELAIEGLNWALCVMGSIMVQTIETNATPTLKAVVRDDVKSFNRALSKTPRGERSRAMLGFGG